MQNVVRWVLVTCVEGEREMERKRRQGMRRNTDMCLRDSLKLLYVVKGLIKYLHLTYICLVTAAGLEFFMNMATTLQNLLYFKSLWILGSLEMCSGCRLGTKLPLY